MNWRKMQTFVNEMEPARPSAAAVADTVVSMLAFPALRAARWRFSMSMLRIRIGGSDQNNTTCQWHFEWNKISHTCAARPRRPVACCSGWGRGLHRKRRPPLGSPWAALGWTSVDPPSPAALHVMYLVMCGLHAIWFIGATFSGLHFLKKNVQ